MSEVVTESESRTCKTCKRTFIPNVLFDFYQDGDDPQIGDCESCMMKSMFSSQPSDAPSDVPPGYQTTVCKMGQGEATCAFLGISTSYQCLKRSSLEGTIRQRLAAGSMGAKGDNCSGPPDFKPS